TPEGRPQFRPARQRERPCSLASPLGGPQGRSRGNRVFPRRKQKPHRTASVKAAGAVREARSESLCAVSALGLNVAWMGRKREGIMVGVMPLLADEDLVEMHLAVNEQVDADHLGLLAHVEVNAVQPAVGLELETNVLSLRLVELPVVGELAG